MQIPFKVTQCLPYVLAAVKCALVVWGILGFIEYFAPPVSLGLQDPNFPRGVQFLHWLLILLTGAIFVVGFLVRWSHTPYATMIMYATLATLCFVETVDFNAFGGGSDRYYAMSAEFILYLVLSAYLLRSAQVRERFA